MFTVPQPAPAEADDGLYDLMPEEPAQPLPAGAQRVFEQPGAYSAGFSREVAPAPTYQAAPAASSRGSARGASSGRPVAARTDRSSGGTSMLAKIGGGIFSVLVVLGLVAKVVRIAVRANSDDTPQTTQREVTGRASVEAELQKRFSAEPPAVRPITPPPRVEPASRGAYQSAMLEVSNSAGTVTRLEVMLPPGKHAAGSLPCVFVAPAGSNLLTGNALESSYTDESLPYVKAGFACVRYSLSGALAHENATPAEREVAYVEFRAAHGGVSDGSAAIDTVIADYPEIDPRRLFVAGHSSAGNAALLVAHKDQRIKAAVAYAPACNLRNRFAPMWSELTEVPGFEAFINDTCPSSQGSPRTPVFLFHARDDSNVPVSESESYARQHRTRVKLSTVPTGDHYQSMIDEGIPAAIKYLINEQRALTRG